MIQFIEARADHRLNCRYIVGSGSLAGVKVVGLGFRSEEEGLAIPRVVDDEELDELNEGVSGLGIQ